jgi:hypothetical protein
MRSKRRLTTILILVLCACQTPSVAFRPVDGTFAAARGERAVVFTFLVREVSVSRSQGVAWYVQTSDDEAKSLYREFATELANAGLSPVDPEAVREQDLVKSGRFQIREEFHLNPESLPVVKSPADEELMSRTARSLGADLFFVILVDHSVSKVLMRPAAITSRFQITAYRASTGKAVFSDLVEKSAQALPFDLESSGADFQNQYRSIMNKTALGLARDAMRDASNSLKSRLTLKPSEEKKPAPIDI